MTAWRSGTRMTDAEKWHRLMVHDPAVIEALAIKMAYPCEWQGLEERSRESWRRQVDALIDTLVDTLEEKPGWEHYGGDSR